MRFQHIPKILGIDTEESLPWDKIQVLAKAVADV